MHALSTVSGRIREVRSLLGYTQKRAGEAVGGKLRSWQEYESGRSFPGGKVLAHLSRLGVNVNWVLTGEGPRLIEDLTTPAAQTPQSFDYELLKDVAKAVDRALDDLDLEMAVNHKWDLIDVLYDMHAESQTRPSHANVIRLVRSAS